MSLSNFLLCHVPKPIYVTDILCPISKTAFHDALAEFAKRDRRFGNVKDF
jgi:undecaprenyl pyrophosphate synthase